MKNILSKTLSILIVCLTLIVSKLHAQVTADSLDKFIQLSMQTHHIPGYAVCIIKNGKIVLIKNYGYANIEKDIPFTPNTIIPEIASISKTITATALMQLWENGHFQLDENINNYLPFAVINPYFPDSIITFRMLLNHTSSLGSGEELILDFNSGLFMSPGLSGTLGNFLMNYFVSGGSMYVDSVSFFNYPPGSQWNYSDFGFALIGYLVEQISGIPFDQYCKQNIFQPLCMNHTGFHFSDVDTNITARPYFYDAIANKQIDYGLYEYAPYPFAQLKTTLIDLSKFLLMNINNGTLDGISILDSSTAALMRTVDFVIDSSYFNLSGGLAWFYFLINGKEFWGHPGDNFGLKTMMFFNLTDSSGIVQFINGEDDATNFDYCANSDDIFCKLIEVTDTISTSLQPDLTCSYVFNPCENTKSYWKNNVGQWPLNSIDMKLGSQYFYDVQELVHILNKSVNGNASTLLAKQLIAAKLNAAQGSELSPIVAVINEANNLIGLRHIPIHPAVSFNSAEGIQMQMLAAALDDYNHGMLNTINCYTNDSTTTEIGELTDVDSDNEINIYPNPFSNFTNITFSLESQENAVVKVLDLRGRLIKTLIDKQMPEGDVELTWNKTDNKGNFVEPGIYLVQLTKENYFKTKLIILLK